MPDNQGAVQLGNVRVTPVGAVGGGLMLQNLGSQGLGAASDVIDFTATADADHDQQPDAGGFADADPSRPGTQIRVTIELGGNGVVATKVMKVRPDGTSFDFTASSGNVDGGQLIDTNGDGRADRIVLTITDNGIGDFDPRVGVIADPLFLAAPNAAPTITSNGAVANAAISLPENSSAVTTVVATDAERDTLSYALAGGADQGKFSLNTTTGVLAFVTAPNFELPSDSNGDNVYQVSVSASDGKGGIALQNLAVSVTDVPIEATLSYSTTRFAEATANNGSITTTSTLTLVGDTFTAVNGAALGAVTHVPAGLTALLVKTSANTATLSFTGAAAAHANANDISNLTVRFGNADFTSAWAAAVSGADRSDLVIDFADPLNTEPTITGVPASAQAVSTGVAAALADFTVADAEQGSTGLSVTLTASNGTINGLVDTDTNTPGIQLVGTAAAINTALAGATFTATAGGAASIAISVSDGVITQPVIANYNLTASTAVTVKDSDHDQFPDALEAANGLTVGVKDNDVFSSSKFFVMQLYRDTLYREGETQGVQYWQQLIDSGKLTRAQLTLTFLDAPEFHASSGAIERLYFGALGSMPEVSFISATLEQMHSGTSLAQLAQTLVASTSFTNIYGQLSNTAYVDALYQHVLQRTAEPAAQQYWLGQLQTGMSRSDLLLSFTESAEYRQANTTSLSVALDFVSLLGRAPDQAGLDYWVNRQNTPLPEITIVGDFIASQEYHDRFLP